MQLSPEDRRAVLEMAAKRIVDEIRAEAGGDLSGMIVLPMGAAAQLIGLSPTNVSRRLPVVEAAAGKHGVTLSSIREFISSRTKNRTMTCNETVRDTQHANEVG
jgi:hypothetical protein